MLFGITISSVVSANTTSVCTLNMLLDAISIILVSSTVFSSVILNNSNISSNTSMLVASYLVLSALSFQ